MNQAARKKRGVLVWTAVFRSLLGRMLGFAHKLTEDEKYKKALLRLIQREGFNGNFCCEIFYSAAPFIMLFETEYNNKEGYNRKKSIQGN